MAEEKTSATLIPVDIEAEMRKSYLDYAMSVIIGRALPDVRDGLKPVHRRILFGMNEMNLTSTRPYRKCAKIPGEVLGKFHPHGDAPVYDALVRMAQPFSLRYPLIDGQGNFASVDGDPPAAMRYTEARLSRIAAQLLEDIDKETVDFRPNYDDSEVEPEVLPTRVPNLLVNGSSGIAVGMATNIPPHNLTEIINATIELIRKPDTPLSKIMEMVPGPDFPTGGFILGREVILNNLYKATQLQISFGIINLSIVNGQPRELGLLDTLKFFIEHRVDVVRRRTDYELRKAREREHLLLGFQRALEHLDEVIRL